MRESFSVMDRDNDGHVNSADVADMLSQLGLSATPSTLASYFNGAQSINLATFLNTLSDLLAGLSRSSELSAAFEAFDDGDDGQINLEELKDALLHTAPEPGAKSRWSSRVSVVEERSVRVARVSDEARFLDIKSSWRVSQVAVVVRMAKVLPHLHSALVALKTR
jgi:hypothetical protein